MASGEFRPMDLDAGVTFIEAVIEGYFVEKFRMETQPDIEKDIAHIHGFILGGIENKQVS
jgi:hypothetical protein